MSDPPTDPWIGNEPQYGGRFRPDPSEQSADEILARAREENQDEQRRVEHSVWDEPGLSAELAGEPSPEDLKLTFRNLLLARRERYRTAAGRSWAITLLVALAAGPWAILGAFWGSAQLGGYGWLAIVVIAPVVEEAMKIGAALWVVEKRPWVFRSPLQILVCALAAGLVFASIENLIYLNIYIPDASPGLARWRWTVCVALHTTCSLVAGLGVVRVWRDTWANLHRANPGLCFGWWIAAVVLHGTYNGLALVVEFIRPTF